MLKNIIVFGGSGFLGSHVADALSADGLKVVIFDRVKSPYLRPGQEMVVGDILDEKKVQKAVEGCDAVYNFAGIADIDEAAEKPFDSVKTNILGNMTLLEASRRAGVKRFVYASSLYVYSKSASFYRSTKQACELLIENYNEVFGLPYTILRYGSIYGPRSGDKNFINRVLREAIRDKKIVREGDGEEIREYIHALDAARGSVEILSDEFVNQCVIITGNQQMKVKDLLLMIREMLDNKIEIEYRKAPKNSHYQITPYNFAPKLAKKLVSRTYFDLGQGILDCMQNIHGELNPTLTHEDMKVK
ncbi:MAG: NAD(P)-dependent oxidoreductase [Candidatus Omnitrophota bacterium]